jgi:hypothetical protein
LDKQEKGFMSFRDYISQPIELNPKCPQNRKKGDRTWFLLFRETEHGLILNIERNCGKNSQNLVSANLKTGYYQITLVPYHSEIGQQEEYLLHAQTYNLKTIKWRSITEKQNVEGMRLLVFSTP